MASLPDLCGTGSSSPPPEAPSSLYRVALFGQTSAHVKVAQRRLVVSADGRFGWPTFRKLVARQKGRVPVTGVLDKATWRRLTGT
jgi:hypothetical protein